MRKLILAASSFLLITIIVISVHAQDTDKKDVKSPQTSTVDAWRQAMPTTEQPPNAPPFADESKDSADSEETTAQIERRIFYLEQKLLEALKQRDAAALKSLIADDFTFAGLKIAGTQPDKVRYINWALKNLELKSYILEKSTVRASPTIAVITFNYLRQANVGGQPADGDFIVTDVWLKRGDEWLAVSRHISQAPKP